MGRETDSDVVSETVEFDGRAVQITERADGDLVVEELGGPVDLPQGAPVRDRLDTYGFDQEISPGGYPRLFVDDEGDLWVTDADGGWIDGPVMLSGWMMERIAEYVADTM